MVQGFKDSRVRVTRSEELTLSAQGRKI